MTAKALLLQQPNGSDAFDTKQVELSDTIEELREEAISCLSPARFAVHSEFLSQLRGEDHDFLRKGVPLIVMVTTPMEGWQLEDVLRSSIEHICAGTEDAVTNVRFHHLGPKKGLRKSFDCSGFVDDVGSGDWLFVTTDGTESFSFDPLVDFRITLPRPGPQAVRDSLTRLFVGASVACDLEPWPEGMTFRMFDVACAKATSPNEAWNLAMRLVSASPKAADAGPAPSAPPLLSQMRGYGVAMTWAEELVRDVADYRSGHIGWSDVSPGALLVGPPGTGKSTFAASVAQATSMTYIPTSYSEWQGSDGGHLGDVTKAIKAVFAKARAQAPSLVFIDEVDTLPARGGSERNDDWWKSVVNTLLEELDGGRGRAGFTVLAACNDDTRLDPALVRSGRLDRKLQIGLPDALDLSEILAQHLEGAVDPGELIGIAQALAGFVSGADAAALARNARRRSRREHRVVVAADVEAVAFPPDDRPQALRRRIAVHEAGHVVAALTTGIVPCSADIFAGGTGGRVGFGERDQALVVASDFESTATMLLAGRAAEILVFGSASAGAGGKGNSDLAAATRLLGSMIGTLGLAGTLVYETSIERGRVEAALQAASVRAHEILVRHRTAFDAFSQELLTRRFLVAADIVEIGRRNGLDVDRQPRPVA